MFFIDSSFTRFSEFLAVNGCAGLCLWRRKKENTINVLVSIGF